MKKALFILLALSFLMVTAVACGGSEVTPGAGSAPAPAPAEEPDVIEDLDTGNEDDTALEDVDIVLPGEGEDHFSDTNHPYYLSITGVVAGMEERDGLRRIEIEDMDGNPAILVLNDETVFPFSTDFAVGDEVTGWFEANAPMIMIWPPEYSIAVLASRMGDDRNIKVDRFNASELSHEKYYISQDEMFMFSTDDNTEIILADGEDFKDGLLEGRRIVVIYGRSTRSIPEQATADKLIVLFESIVPLG